MSRTVALPLDAIARRELASIAADSIAKGSRSFAAAANLFDRQTRESATMLYAWCRHCDDVIDGQHLGFARWGDGATVPPRVRLEEIERRTAAALAGEPGEEPAFRAIAEVAARHGLPARLVLDHLAGYRMDVEGRRYRTIEDTLEYCYGVAGVVGVMLAIVMGAKDEATLDRACDLGIAFQLTNIARDIVEDAGVGRIYLPADWLDEVGLSPGDIAGRRRAERVAILARRLVDLAEPYYVSSLGGLGDLPLRSAWAVAMAHGIYREIGLQVRALGAAAWETRVSTGKRVKLRHVATGARLALASRRLKASPRPVELWTRPRRAGAG